MNMYLLELNQARLMESLNWQGTHVMNSCCSNPSLILNTPSDYL
jgi:hypothetical protein